MWQSQSAKQKMKFVMSLNVYFVRNHKDGFEIIVDLTPALYWKENKHLTFTRDKKIRAADFLSSESHYFGPGV